MQLSAVRDRRYMRYIVQSGKSYKTDEMEHRAVRALMGQEISAALLMAVQVYD